MGVRGMPARLAALVAAFGIASLVVQYVKRYRKPQRKLPPSPPGLPFVGHVFSVPAENFWIKYIEWSREYGVSQAPLGQDVSHGVHFSRL